MVLFRDGVMFFFSQVANFLCHGPRGCAQFPCFFSCSSAASLSLPKIFRTMDRLPRCEALRSLAEVSRYQSWNYRTIKSETTKKLLIKNQMNTINNIYYIINKIIIQLQFMIKPCSARVLVPEQEVLYYCQFSNTQQFSSHD